jgi:hypothetical protein
MGRREMNQHDLRTTTEAALQDVRRAKAQLYRRVEAARFSGAKILLALQELEGIRHAPSPSEARNSN